MPSRKDYVAVAAVIAKAYHESVEAKGEIADIAYELSGVFAADNISFDRTKFLEECGVNS
jgi:hypothetical protein